MKTIIIKKAQQYNKGKIRVWLENTILTEQNINRGDLFYIDTENRCIVFGESENYKTKKVSGKLDKPIIDITGKNAALLVGDFVSYKVINDGNKITFESND